MPIYLWRISQFNYECLQVGTSQKQWDTKLSVTHKHDVLSVYCWYVIFFEFFFITLMFVYLQKLLHCLIIYSYKTNPSFLPCPWNLRSIGPSDFKSWYLRWVKIFLHTRLRRTGNSCDQRILKACLKFEENRCSGGNSNSAISFPEHCKFWSGFLFCVSIRGLR